MLKLRIPHLLAAALLVGLFCVVSAPVFACMQASCAACVGCSSCIVSGSSVICSGCGGGGIGQEFVIPAGPQTGVLFLKDNRVRVRVDGYLTTELNPATDCVTGFPPLESVAQVDSVVNYNGLTDRPFTEVEFYALEGPGSAIAELAEIEGVGSNGQNWHAFRSNITGSVEDGVPNYFLIELTLKEGTDPLDFVDQLKQSGMFLTSGSDEDGIPNHHPFFRQLNSGPMLVGLASGTSDSPDAPELPLPFGGPVAF